MIYTISFVLVLFVFCTCAQNPLQGKRFYVDPTFQKNVDKTIGNLSPGEPDLEKIKTNLQIARDTSTAQWLNSMGKVHPNSTDSFSMNGILLDAAKQTPVPMVMFIINNLPNKGCTYSGAEICCTTDSNNKCDYLTTGDCSQGLQTYKNSFIDNVVSIMNRYKNTVPMAFVIEPNAVASKVTGANNPKCGNIATQTSYKEGVTYAINELTRNAPSVPIYLDLGHGGWLGSNGAAQKASALVKSWNILDKIRGFATNIGGYQPIGEACPEPFYCGNGAASKKCCSDPCGLTSQSNPANNELNYVQQMETLMPGKHYVIDTGRSGVEKSRSSCTNWCNPRNAGLGIPATSDTPLPIVDAFFWFKKPGESDGCTETLPTGDACKSFSSACASSDSLGSAEGEPRLPGGGTFSPYQMTMLARNANFGTYRKPEPPAASPPKELPPSRAPVPPPNEQPPSSGAPSNELPAGPIPLPNVKISPTSDTIPPLNSLPPASNPSPPPNVIPPASETNPPPVETPSDSGFGSLTMDMSSPPDQGSITTP